MEDEGGDRQTATNTQQHHILPFYHVPQQSRREKLRYSTPQQETDLSPPPSTSTNPIFMSSSLSLPTFPHHPTAVSLTLSSPTEPFTGYASVLKTSRFLRPAQQMLDEICSFGGVAGLLNGSDSGGELGLDSHHHCDLDGDGGEIGRVKSRLISMLDEVYRRYKQYVQQVECVMASFENVAGLDHAAPYTCLVISLMTKHFRCLKDAIAEQLRFTNKQTAPFFGGHSKASSAAIDHVNVWRPQRGLPDRAVSVLKAWLFEHFLHPYPTDADKHMLAKQTGLSRNQVSNWFINARVRLWKPLVEEIHGLEMRQAQSNPDVRITTPECGKTVEETAEGPPCKRFRDKGVEASLMDVPSHRGGGISLTLGLHQNKGVPLNLARRFGLDVDSTIGGDRKSVV